MGTVVMGPFVLQASRVWLDMEQNQNTIKAVHDLPNTRGCPLISKPLAGPKSKHLTILFWTCQLSLAHCQNALMTQQVVSLCFFK